MKKSFANRFSPQPVPSSTHKSHSLKENQTARITPNQPLRDHSRILTLNNDSELTNKQLDQKIPPRRQTRKTEPPTLQSSSSTCNIPTIRHSIREILNESIKVNTEIKKLKEKLSTNLTNRENSPKCPEFDESSIQCSPIKEFSFSSQVADLKSQLKSLSNRLNQGEAKIKEKAFENFNLQFTVFSLARKLEKLKKKQVRRKKTTSQMCEMF